MDNVECDFTTMTQILKKDIHKVIKELQSNLEVIDDEDNCLLCNFEKIKKEFLEIEIKAASFYLNCYLAPFTDKYPALSLSLQNMSRMKHGALIVIEREESLETLIRPGIPIGAELTHSLLESVFYPGNPLHDGAVLVRLNQIVSAANVLPLSDIYTGDKKLGTRHRAALGLSERSDALVLVVSEETGRISFAKGGNMYPITTHGGL